MSAGYAKSRRRRADNEPRTSPTPAADWRVIYNRYYTFKAARCEASGLKSVVWYCLPVIREFEEAGIPPQKLRQVDYEERQARRKQSGINNNTLRKEQMMFSAMLDLGVRERMITRNSIRNMPLPAKVTPYTPTPTTEGVLKMLKTVRDKRRPSKNPGAKYLTKDKNTFLWKRDTAIIVLGARTGLRPGEIFRLVLEDYQPEEGRLAVRIAKDREPRYVPIYADVVATVDDWLKVRPPSSETRHLFVQDGGVGMSVNSWSKLFKEYSSAAEMPEITPRSLRHYGLTTMAKTNLLAASKAAGHSDLATTKGYLHNDFAHTREELAKVAHLDLSAIKDGRSRKRVI